jgi:hypothetical protein
MLQSIISNAPQKTHGHSGKLQAASVKHVQHHFDSGGWGINPKRSGTCTSMLLRP